MFYTSIQTYKFTISMIVNQNTITYYKTFTYKFNNLKQKFFFWIYFNKKIILSDEFYFNEFNYLIRTYFKKRIKYFFKY